MTRAFTSDDWATPKNVVDLLEAFGGVDCDPCANPWSIIKSRFSYNHPDRDGLAMPWSLNGLTFINPPYSKPAPWMKKAHTWLGESIVLVNYDATAAWRDYGWTGEAIAFFYSRLKFIGPLGHSSRAANAFIYRTDVEKTIGARNARLNEFARLLEPVARVIHMGHR